MTDRIVSIVRGDAGEAIEAMGLSGLFSLSGLFGLSRQLTNPSTRQTE